MVTRAHGNGLMTRSDGEESHRDGEMDELWLGRDPQLLALVPTRVVRLSFAGHLEHVMHRTFYRSRPRVSCLRHAWIDRSSL
jgi:hypothetical protein